MKNLSGHFSDNFEFGIERYKRGLRLIISANKDEAACRKETFKNLNLFLETQNDIIFKGRLQLKTDNNEIILYLRGEEIGR